jgi:hypothetical protein
MKNLISTLFLVTIYQLSYTQSKVKYPKLMIVEKDTVMCFTIQQSKQMAIWNESRKECLELSKLDKEKIVELNKISTKKDSIISNLENTILLCKKNVDGKQSLVNVCDSEKKQLKKEIRKQRRGKWIAIIGGVFLSLLCLTV